jgi:hypothetical protein
VLAERQADAAPLEAEYADDQPPLHRLLLSRRSVQKQVREAQLVSTL